MDAAARTSTADGTIVSGSLDSLSTIECAVLVYAAANTKDMEELRSACSDLLAQHSPGTCSRYELLRELRSKAGDALLTAIRNASDAASAELPARQKVWVGAQPLYQAFHWLAQTEAGHKGGECMGKCTAPGWVALLNSVTVCTQWVTCATCA